jgi:superfamily II DNA or RNA helicase
MKIKKITKHEPFVFCSTWQSLYQLPPEYFHQFDFIIGDEAHLCKANSLKHIIENCINAKYRIGLSGSLDGTVVNEITIEGLFGKKFVAAKTYDLQKSGDLAQIEINALVLKHPDQVCMYASKSKPDYDIEMNYLVGSTKRNDFICNLALSLKGNTIIFYHLVEKHGKLLYDILKQKDSNRPIFIVHKDITPQEREDIRKYVATVDNAIIVASYKTFSTGINIRNLHNGIFATSFKSLVTNLQSIGRGLRTHDSKDKFSLFDIADDMRYKKYENFTLKHFKERLNLYTREKFKFKIHNITL